MLTVAVPKRNKLPNIIVLTPKDGFFVISPLFCSAYNDNTGKGGKAIIKNTFNFNENIVYCILIFYSMLQFGLFRLKFP